MTTTDSGPLPNSPRPNPTQAPRIDDPRRSPSERRLDCQGYDGCVDAAVAGGWDGFHCKACQAYLPQTPAQRAKDHYAILEMLVETQLWAGLRQHDALTGDEVDPAESGPLQVPFADTPVGE